MTKAILISDDSTYMAERKDNILTVSMWGPEWTHPGKEVGVVDLDDCRIVKAPEDLSDMEVLIEAMRALADDYGLDGYEIYINRGK